MPYLFLAHIGPVQDFIASARRSRDLWFGSWLLSELSKAAAAAIAASGSGSLIFPSPPPPSENARGPSLTRPNIPELEPNSDFNVANKVLALIEGDPAALGDAVRAATLDRLRAIRKVAYASIHGPFNEDIARKQVDDLLEFYWAAVPFDPPADYRAAREQLEAVMAARKATRNFGKVTWGSSQPKSSLDGQRESVIPEDQYDRLTRRELFEQYGVRPGERLDGVGLLKRHGERRGDPRFFSTSHVAALPLLARLPASAKPAVDAYVAALRDLGMDKPNQVPGKGHSAFGTHDGHLLFEERLAEQLEGAALADARRLLRDFLETQLQGKRPRPYYALLRADGDRMGQAIERIDDMKRHQELSARLAEFAGEAKRLVEDYDGWLIYSGGDDALAFLPLHQALPCAAKLARAFRGPMSAFDTDTPGVHPTLSVGIAVAHHLDPLSDALELAAEAERAAKRTRNAVAVTVSKRSGVDRTVSGAWGKLDTRLEKFIGLHLADAVPDGAAFELATLARRLTVDPKDPAHKSLTAAMGAEAVRILERKQPEGGRQKQIARKNLEELKALTEADDVSIGQLADELIVAREFARAVSLAQPALPEAKEVVA